jgi:AbrB family looped-hinge helix DNA binding protein
MRRARITRGGQISIPAEVRHRWDTSTVTVEDHGDHLVLRPAPDNPVRAAIGLLADLEIDTAELRRRAREDEAIAEDRRSA